MATTVAGTDFAALLLHTVAAAKGRYGFAYDLQAVGSITIAGGIQAAAERLFTCRSGDSLGDQTAEGVYPAHGLVAPYLILGDKEVLSNNGSFARQL